MHRPGVDDFTACWLRAPQERLLELQEQMESMGTELESLRAENAHLDFSMRIAQSVLSVRDDWVATFAAVREVGVGSCWAAGA